MPGHHKKKQKKHKKKKHKKHRGSAAEAVETEAAAASEVVEASCSAEQPMEVQPAGAPEVAMEATAVTATTTTVAPMVTETPANGKAKTAAPAADSDEEDDGDWQPPEDTKKPVIRSVDDYFNPSNHPEELQVYIKPAEKKEVDQSCILRRTFIIIVTRYESGKGFRPQLCRKSTPPVPHFRPSLAHWCTAHLAIPVVVFVNLYELT